MQEKNGIDRYQKYMFSSSHLISFVVMDEFLNWLALQYERNINIKIDQAF